MLTIHEVIKTLYNALLQRLKKHRGNWEQNDPTADDYIKNRPFYTDEKNHTIILPEQTLSVLNATLKEPLIIGETYIVTFNGTDYKCVCRYYEGYKMLGNNAIYEDDGGITTDTGEPFALEAEGDSKKVYFYLKNNSESPIVKIGKVKVVKLDKKYLPDLGLSPVATSGSYYDLEDTPAVYSDVVRYGTSQSLTDAQKTQARTNIGAAATSDLATVANSGDYNDLNNKPCSKIVTESGEITITQLNEEFIPNTIARVSELHQSDWNISDETSLAYIKNRIVYEDHIDTTIETYDASTRDFNSLHEVITSTKATDSNGYYSYTVYSNSAPVILDTALPDNIVVNEQLYSGIHIASGSGGVAYPYGYSAKAYGNLSLIPLTWAQNTFKNTLKIQNFEAYNNDEEFVLIKSYETQHSGSTKRIWYYLFSKIAGYELPQVYTRTYDLKQLDEKFIPSTIARIDDIPSMEGLATEDYVSSAIETAKVHAEPVADAAGDAPTATEFNALLASLRAAGLLKTEETTE